MRCNRKRCCIVTQGELLYYDIRSVIVLWNKESCCFMT